MAEIANTPDQSESYRRDRLWEAVFETYYDAYYEEILSGDLIDRWQSFDEFAKIVIALTASGSAVSGWALWTQPGFRAVWAVLAGLALSWRFFTQH
jgi:hypothetical protein